MWPIPKLVWDAVNELSENFFAAHFVFFRSDAS